MVVHATGVPRGPMLLLTVATFLVFFPFFFHFPAWLTVAMVMLLIYRAMTVLRNWPMPNQALLLSLTALLSLGVYASFGSLFGRDGGTAALIVLLAAKLNESRVPRDAFVLTVMSYFALTANFFFSQDLLISVYSLLSAFLVTATIPYWRNPRTNINQQLRRLLPLFVQAVPLAVVLFLVFPRPASPLWGLPAGGGGVTGLADEINPGSFSTLAQSDQVAFRAEFSGDVPALGDRYWRGPVFEFFNGRSWKQQSLDLLRSYRLDGLPIESRGPVYVYKVTLEPHGKPWVLALDRITALQGQARVTQNYQVVTRPVLNRQRFFLQSSPRALIGREESPVTLNMNLALPSGLNPQARNLAAKWKSLSPPERVQQAIEYFRSGQFQYTLTPPKLNSIHTVDAFLFGTRQGFCEHFAGSFTFLMRAAGVPARVVGGYLGGEENGGYMIVRQSDAHAWSEVWLEGQGWVRIDPTSAAVPARLTAGAAGSVEDPSNLPPLSRHENSWTRRLGLQLDSMQYGWDQWVIGYDAIQQELVWARFGWGTAGFFGVLLVLFGLGSLPWWRLRRDRQPLDPALAVYLEFTGKFAKQGLVRGVGETPTAFASRVAGHFPALQGEIEAITEMYLELRYGEVPASNLLPGFRQRVRQFQLPS